jgi:hypothetical protein
MDYQYVFLASSVRCSLKGPILQRSEVPAFSREVEEEAASKDTNPDMHALELVYSSNSNDSEEERPILPLIFEDSVFDCPHRRLNFSIIPFPEFWAFMCVSLFHMFLLFTDII